MNGLEKRCIVEVFRSKYRLGRKRLKGEILAEVSARLKVGRRQARRLLGAERRVGRPRNGDRRGRPSKYGDAEFRAALRIVWTLSGFMCSRMLRAAIPHWLPVIELERGRFTEGVRSRLLSISAPTIDRILKPHRALRGKSLTRPGGFRDQIPIQGPVWDIREPGFLEADTTAHCGGSMLGEFLNCLTLVDIATIWTETRAVFGRGSTPIVGKIEDIEQQLPFAIKGYDADNGTEVLNQHILRYFRDERLERGRTAVQVTRSRAYYKNDNAHVEQRNDAVARKWLGYERIDFPELVPLVNYYFRDVVCPLLNHFYPTFKLQDKIRVKSRTRRIYAEPQTPYSRVMASSFIDEDRKAKLLKLHNSLNPLKLMREEKRVRKNIDAALKSLRRGLSAERLLECVPAQSAPLPTPPQCSPPPNPEGDTLKHRNQFQNFPDTDSTVSKFSP